jgi:propionyl-CoA synthetase
VASFRTALVVVAGVPKTRSGKILCGRMRKIAAGENYSLLATIDDPAVVAVIDRALATAGYAER